MLRALQWTVLLAPYLLGLFFPWTSAFISVALAALLLRLLRQGRLCLTKSPAFLASAGLVIFLLLGVFYGTDRGMAPVGAVQFLPLPLFVLALEQFTQEQRESIVPYIRYGAFAMVPLSLLLGFALPQEGWFLVAGRQAGFFQYPNSYALYLLCGVVAVLFGKPPRFGMLPWLAVLTLGILLSGSRTVFILLAAVLLFSAIYEKDRKRRLQVISVLVLAVLAGIAYAAVTGDRSGAGRFLTISPQSSELLGRLLYARDAIPQILQNPFGLGYMGWYWLQGSFQTGVYTVTHVHNDLLQLLLDVGWVPTLLFLWAILRGLFSKRNSPCRRMLTAVICLHALLDFDLQFVSLALLLLFAADAEAQATVHIRRRVLPAGLLAVCIAASCWIGSASMLAYFGHERGACRVYPGYTTALISCLEEADADETEELADRIRQLNRNAVPVWKTRARSFFSSGDYKNYAETQKEIIRLTKYQLSSYTDYFQNLRKAYETCARTGNPAVAAWCLDEMAGIPDMLKDAENGTSRLGRMIQDQPELTLPKEMTVWLNAHINA